MALLGRFTLIWLPSLLTLKVPETAWLLALTGRVNKTLVFFTHLFCSKNELSVRSRTVGPQTPDTAQSHSSRVSPASGCSASQAGISREIPTLRGRKPPPSARRCGKIALTFSMHWSVNSRVQCSLRGLRGGLPFLFFPTAAGAGDASWMVAGSFASAAAGGAATSGTGRMTVSDLSTTGRGQITRRFFTTMTREFLSWFLALNTPTRLNSG